MAGLAARRRKLSHSPSWRAALRAHALATRARVPEQSGSHAATMPPRTSLDKSEAEVHVPPVALETVDVGQGA
jgi:hypothetical protein